MYNVDAICIVHAKGTYRITNTGSIFGCSEVAVLERAVTKEKFKEMNQRLPDWSSCDPEQHELLRPVPTRKLLPAAPTSLYKSSKSQPAH